ncbi:valine--tRNA ligase [Vulcanisaeta thermophila]|uniref:valine--tRNA ligase n=1 Tax=Vulcanisaeta thermophila TaxID=867917 RepID=UPI000852D4E0|nr:valine--tRNA ligase [Vulcanisaeta thermophila]
MGTNFSPRLAEKRWDFSKEVELIRRWEEEGLFNVRVTEGKPILVIDTPPPYPSGRPHIGGMAHYAQIDMIARFFRMRGYNVVFPWYADRNGLPVEVQVEKTYGVNMYEVPREKFLELCRRFLDEYEGEFVSIFRRWGGSFTYWRNGTDSEEYRRMTQETFITLWNRGLIYEASRPTLWCPRCRTALAEAEVEYDEEDSYLNYIKFRVKETGEDIIIATTRPELLPATVAVAFNPEDERYKRLEGLHAVVPPLNQEVPIVTHPSVKKEYGTGIEMISTFGDTRDLMVVNELRLPMRVIVNPDGTLNELAGKYRGMRIREAREAIIRDLESMGLLVKRERIRHTVPICWRCKTPIEIVITREYFLKQLQFKEGMIKMVNEEMIFEPPEYKQTLIDWIKSLEFDWPISRRRYYGTEIPIWYCIDEEGNAKPIVPKPGSYYRPWRDEPPQEVKEQCPSGKLVGEDRVLDTWFDSSISWMYASGYTKKEINLFQRAHPHSILRPQGYDIIRTWLYYSVLRSYLLYGKPPFRYVRISGMGLDEKGEAMHKSKGNIIDSLQPVEKYGADAVRFWAAAAAKLGSDYRYSEQLIRTGHDFAIKLWNIARFISAFPEVSDDYELTPLDLMILAKLNEVARTVISAYEKFDVYVPINTLFDFTWHVFADHYLEAVKSRAYNREGLFTERQQRGAWFTLYRVLKAVLKLLAPIMPFVTDYIWRSLYGTSIHTQLIEDPDPRFDNKEYLSMLEPFIAFNSAVWTYKNRNGLSLNEPINAVIYAPETLKPIANELRAMHKIAELRFGKPGGNAEVLDEKYGIYLLKP